MELDTYDTEVEKAFQRARTARAGSREEAQALARLWQLVQVAELMAGEEAERCAA